MKKLYVIVPSALVVAFAIHYSSYSVEYRQREAAAKERAIAEERAAEQERLEYQRQVQQEALAAAAAKSTARAEKEAREREEEAAWVALNAALGDAQARRDRLSSELYDATNAFYLAEDRKRRAEETLDRKKTEREHLERYVAKSLSALERVRAILQQAERLAAARQAAAIENKNA